MEVKMQTSFIPKKPIIESRSSGSGVSLFTLISTILFIAAIALSVGVWLWQNALIAQVKKGQVALETARNLYEEETINNLVRLDDRIKVTRGVLNNHIAVTPILTTLEESVLKNVRLKNLKFSYGGNNKIDLSITGAALNYDVLYKQADSFKSDNLSNVILQPVFSNFTPNTDGTISFDLTAQINPSLISYNNTVADIIVPDIVVSTSTATSTIPEFDLTLGTSTATSAAPIIFDISNQ